jgi:hypothetical protein
MIWGEETAGRTDQFEAKVLPRAGYEDSEHSFLLGVGSTQPETAVQAEAGGLTNVEASAGKTAWRRRLSPKHRRAVGTFFTKPTSSND